MSYYDLPTGNADVELGRAIYMNALDDRRGFRYDQIGIEDPDIWSEIFEAMGKAARAALEDTRHAAEAALSSAQETISRLKPLLMEARNGMDEHFASTDEGIDLNCRIDAALTLETQG